MSRRARSTRLLAGLLAVAAAAACSPASYREDADRTAYEIIHAERTAALGEDEPFTIERPAETLRRRLLLGQDLPRAAAASLGTAAVEPIESWPDPEYLATSRVPAGAVSEEGALGASGFDGDGTVAVTLSEALEVAARNSFDYQDQKEQVFQAALRLDLERNGFRGILAGGADSELSRDLGASPKVSGVENGADASWSRSLKNGVSFALSLGIDLAKLLTQERPSSVGYFGDASITIPLLRGSSRIVVSEPLTQAQRDVVYAIYSFERFKRDFAVRVASDYLGVLEQFDQVRNAEQNYSGLVRSTRRARRLADAGRLPEIQVDQAQQDELRARNRWISAQQSADRRLDRFKTLIGLPTDARITLDAGELERLANVVALREVTGEGEAGVPPADAPVELVAPTYEDAGPLELPEEEALRLAYDNRLDLRTAIGRIFDAQRGVVVAADDLRADLTLLGSASAGSRRALSSAGLSDGGLRPERGFYSALLSVDLPIERTSERNTYRNSLIQLEQQVRAVQELEDQIKLEVRDDLRTLLEARESLRIQEQAVVIANRRVESTDLFLQAGRAEIRDVLEAQEARISAQNALTSARVQYRVSELELQRDLDLLDVDERGLWREFEPDPGMRNHE